MAKQALAILLAIAALIFAGYEWGTSDATATMRADQVKAAKTAADQFQAELDRGRLAAASYATAADGFRDRFQNLEGLFNELSQRVPLVVYRPRVVVAVPGPGAGPAAGPAGREAVPAPGEADPPAVSLTLGAVWMWNSALAGTDVPAGACGAADTATATCAADAGLGLADAWANQQTNAKSCAVDRLRYQHLIDYLAGRAK